MSVFKLSVLFQFDSSLDIDKGSTLLAIFKEIHVSKYYGVHAISALEWKMEYCSGTGVYRYLCVHESF